MKQLLLIVVISILATACFAAGRIGETVRDFTLPDINDRPVALSSLIGKQVILMDFWASWCAPCLSLMPELEKIHQENDMITVVGINIDNPRALRKAKNLIRSQKYTMVSLYDTNQEISKRFQVTSIPHTIIVGLDGTIIYEHTGYTRGVEAEILKVINDYLATLETKEPQTR